MKKELSSAQVAVIIAVFVTLLIGVGIVTLRGGQPPHEARPAAASRADMIRNLRSSASSGREQRTHPGEAASP